MLATVGRAAMLDDFAWMFSVNDAAASVAAAPSSVYAHSRTVPGADGVPGTGIENWPAASGCSDWVRTTIEPSLLLANWAATQRSAGHVVVTRVGIASRLKKYGNSRSWSGVVPVAVRISG